MIFISWENIYKSNADKVLLMVRTEKKKSSKIQLSNPKSMTEKIKAKFKCFTKS